MSERRDLNGVLYTERVSLIAERTLRLAQISLTMSVVLEVEGALHGLAISDSRSELWRRSVGIVRRKD